MPLTLFEKLGDGCFADVWRGQDDLDRHVAVKIIRAASVGIADALAHAKALARLNHPNIVTVHRVDRVIPPDATEAHDCVVMELLEGDTLGKIIEQAKPISIDDLKRIAYGVLDGLEHIHDHGMVHADLHADNVIVGPERVKIIDILYRDTLALLSTVSRQLSYRHDLSRLRILIELLLEHSVLGQEAARDFTRLLDAHPSAGNIRDAFDIVIEYCMNPPLSNSVGNVEVSDFVRPTVYFRNERIARAFPGARGVVEFDSPKEVADRLDILLRSPLGFQKRGTDPNRTGTQHPIWWWRGNGSSAIEEYHRLSETDILINGDELRVRRATIFNPPVYYQCFVYLEFSPMEPTGLYKRDEKSLEVLWKQYGGVADEYAIFMGHMITRAEYDDGAAIIGGKIVDTRGKAELRARYITPHNFVIASQGSPINNSQFDRHLAVLMRGILAGERSVDELAAAVTLLPRHHTLDT